MFLSEWLEFPSAPCLAKKKNFMTARVSMLLRSRASLTCFRAGFVSGRAKDFSAPCKSWASVPHCVYRIVWIVGLTSMRILCSNFRPHVCLGVYDSAVWLKTQRAKMSNFFCKWDNDWKCNILNPQSNTDTDKVLVVCDAVSTGK